jgi:hypothetical protein
MKTITINVSEPTYRAFQDQARRQDRTASELIREAMEQYRHGWARGESSLLDLPPLQVGKVLVPLEAEDDLLAEMTDGGWA